MNTACLSRVVLWIGILVIGISLWGWVLFRPAIFWYTLAGGLALVIFAGIQIYKED